MTANIATPSLDGIIRAVAYYYQLAPSHLRSKGRRKTLAQARHIACYLARKLTNCSYPEIGCALGGRDHTTIMHGDRKIALLVADGRNQIAADVFELKIIIRGEA